jgi:putative hydrolase of the HAD superfamily
MIGAVLFDLDDTLFDHKHSRLAGLAALQTKHPQLASVALSELEREHEKLLSVDYIDVLDKKISMADGTTRRLAKLCQLYDLNLSLEDAQATGNLYSKIYAENRRAVPGSKDLLIALKTRGVTVGIVSNGLVEAQEEKLAVCGFGGLLDFLVVSEAVGYKKPSPEIFQAGLAKAGVLPSEAVFVGDSWSSDVSPAAALGLHVVWLNRYGLSCPDSSLAREVAGLESAATSVLLDW